jgi:segregation and condensation protein B
MSLKAKLEAAIYAAEEPVTLNQLAGLFAVDALEWKAAREASSAAGDSALGSETEPLLNAEIDDQQLEQATATAAEPEITEAPQAADEAGEEAASTEAGPTSGTEARVEPGGESNPESAEHAGSEPVQKKPADPDAEAKRLARARDREVRTILSGILDDLIADYASDERGIEIKEIAGGYRMATKPECHDAARMFVKSLKPVLKLSLPALETLAVIAYKQPVTAPEVNEIRGVDSSGVFGSLLARKLIATAGRKQVIGRPILYKTTKEFLLRFGLKDVTELPSMEEFEKMAQLEFDEMEPVTEGSAASDAGENSFAEIDEDPDEPSDEALRPVEDQEAAEIHEPDAVESAANSVAHAEANSAEAAPAAPDPIEEQAETETVPHD